MDSSEYESLVQSYKNIQVISEKSFESYPEDTKIAAFSIVDEENFDFGVQFFNFLAQIFKSDVDFGFIDENAEDENLISLREGISNSEVVIFAFFVHSDVLDDDEKILKLNHIVENLAESKKSVGVFFSPNHIPEELNIPIKINLPAMDQPSIAAAAMYLAGRKPF
ncbi:MAG: hypothetical protein ACPLX7_08475 [Candidatus Kapaibacteriota bacterium]|jgi:hypothetical protein